MKKQIFNPILPSWEYIPDGEPHIFKDRLYLFGSHDRFNGTQFCMNDYVLWSCPVNDLSDWKYEGVIYRKEQDPAANENSIMQAPDVIEGQDGKFYLYYTLGLVPLVSVAVSDKPEGPYEFYGYVKHLDGTPLGRKAGDVFPFDPGLFMDDDNKIYLYTGFGVPDDSPYAAATKKYGMEGAYCIELESDMLTIKTEAKMILSKSGMHGFFEASSMRKIDEDYYFIYSSQQQHELCYAKGKSPFGPFTYERVLISNGNIGITEKQSNYTGNNHGSLVKIYDRWYIFYHRHTNRHQYSRQACAEKIVFNDGQFLQSRTTSCGLNDGPLNGVGEYEAYIACELYKDGCAISYGLDNTPEAETHPYFTQSGEDREENGDQYIANMRDSATAVFSSFQFNGLKKIRIELSGEGKGGFAVTREPDGIPICHIPVDVRNKREWFDGISENVIGESSLYFTFHGEGSINFHMFKLEER